MGDEKNGRLWGITGGEVLCILDYMLCRRLGDNGGAKSPVKKGGFSYNSTNYLPEVGLEPTTSGL